MSDSAAGSSGDGGAQQRRQSMSGDELTWDGQFTMSLMEAALNITFAGFGGALAGLSISRRRGTTGLQAAARKVRQKGRRTNGSESTTARGSTSLTSQNATTRFAERNSAFVDNDLPVTWAVSCMTFATVLECCKRSSPTSQLLALLNNSSSGNNSEIFFVDQDVHIIGDYGMGGAVAGAIFKGSVIRSSNNLAANRPSNPQMMAAHKSSRASAMLASGGVMQGLVAGASMGLIAGVMVYGLTKLEHALDNNETDRQKLDNAQQENLRDEIMEVSPDGDDANDEKIPVVLTSEELRIFISEIEKLRNEKDPPQQPS